MLASYKNTRFMAKELSQERDLIGDILVLEKFIHQYKQISALDHNVYIFKDNGRIYAALLIMGHLPGVELSGHKVYDLGPRQYKRQNLSMRPESWQELDRMLDGERPDLCRIVLERKSQGEQFVLGMIKETAV